MFGRGTARKMRPVIATQQGNIPLHGGGKIGIHRSLCATQAQVDDMQVDQRNGGKTPENRGHMRHRMRGNRQYAQRPVAHAILAKTCRRRLSAQRTVLGTKKPYIRCLYNNTPRETTASFAALWAAIKLRGFKRFSARSLVSAPQMLDAKYCALAKSFTRKSWSWLLVSRLPGSRRRNGRMPLGVRHPGRWFA